SEELELTHLVGVDHVDQLLHLLEYRGSQKESLEEVVHRFDFESLVEEYGLDSSPEPQVTLKQDYELVLKKDFTEWCSLLASKKIFSFDLETTSLDVHKAEIVGFACCFDDEKAYYVPCGHVERADDQITKEELCEALKAILENPEVKKVGQNLKYDVEVLLTHGVHVRGVWFDTMIAAYLLHPDTGGYGLTQLAKEHLRYEMIEYNEVVQDGQLFSDVSLAEAVAYAAEDAHIAWLLYEKFAPLIEKYELKRVCYEVENPLIEVLAAVEHFGMRLDSTLLESMSKDVAIQLRDLEGRIYGEAECEFNLNSPKQIGEVLFDKLGISTQGVKKTKTGYSTNQAVLEKLADEHPVPALILEYRGLHKLKSTYLDSLPKEVSEVTGRLHTRLNQTIAATGRLSSSEPNLQNIPIQTELGRRVRAAFIPSEGSLLISADYSQIELRLLAHLSGDEALIDSFRHGIDIHERTAREVLDIPEGETVTSEQRRLGKTMNFGIVYGMSGFRLARELGISVGEGNDYIERYFGRYPKVQQYFDSLEKQMEESGEVRTLLGRRRVISEIEQGARDRNFVKRAAMNAPLQGSAADLIKLAMIRMDRVIREESLPLTMVLQVHDELLFELSMNSLAEGNVQHYKLRIQQEMEGVMELSVPLSVGVSSGDNWEEAHS
ncbi:MAG: DNA polymerase I, partial [Bdellovibrionales bacterium]|nr:DNA polymerase I [Bdellovibrionales bacterium]